MSDQIGADLRGPSRLSGPSCMPTVVMAEYRQTEDMTPSVEPLHARVFWTKWIVSTPVDNSAEHLRRGQAS